MNSNSSMVDAILRAVRRQRPQGKIGQREDIAPDLLEQIKAEATLAERRRATASDILAKAFAALR